MAVGGKPHAHSFVLDSNGKPFGKATATRTSMTTVSGIAGFTFMKSTESGWDQYVKDEYTTIPETRDRMCATAMDASWRWRRRPNDYAAANAKILEPCWRCSPPPTARACRTASIAWARRRSRPCRRLSDISLACPNKHYLLINLQPFGLDNENQVFLPTDEPHGQIECTVGRG